MRSLDLRRLMILAVLLPGASALAQAPRSWVSTWAAAPSAANNEVGGIGHETTLREIVHLSRGGNTVRVTLSNELGTDSLRIEGAHVGLRSEGSSVPAGSDQPLLFNGQPAVVIPPGALAVSDPVDLKAAPLSDLAITLAIPAQQLHVFTAHSLALQTSYEAEGNQLGNSTLTGAKPVLQWRFLKSVEVAANDAAATVVAFGDSITDGYRSTLDTNRRWPDILAQRLEEDKQLHGTAVINEGISGNRILHDVAGPNALARFDRDVLSQSGVRYLIILEGINDIGHTVQPRTPGDPVTVEQITTGLEQLVTRAHAHGIKVIGTTLTPFLGAGYSSPTGEGMRQAVNTWIRTPGHFDGVVDFDKVVRDEAHPASFAPAFDSGDHLHPGDAGYKAMGDSIPLSLFRR